MNGSRSPKPQRGMNISSIKLRSLFADRLQSIISYTNSTKDFMVPSAWGTVDKKDDPYVREPINPLNYHHTNPNILGTATIRRMLCCHVEDRACGQIQGVLWRMGFR